MSPLEIQRLILRPWLMTDLDDLFEYSQDERVGSMAGWKPHAIKADALNALEQYMLQEHHWAIVEKKSGKVIGAINLPHITEKSTRKRAFFNEICPSGK